MFKGRKYSSINHQLSLKRARSKNTTNMGWDILKMKKFKSSHFLIAIKIITIIIILIITTINGQRTELDIQLSSIYRNLRTNINKYYGNVKSKNDILRNHRELGKLQKQFPENFNFFCNINGSHRRSASPPLSVHKLRPGDIDIIGALGDSLTSGNGITSRNIMEMLIENKGIVFSIGGDLTWRDYLTLPNILKEYNPNLYGYSIDFASSFNKKSRFNIAEPAAMYQDMKYQAELFQKRLISDPKVNITHHWKLLTIFFGHNNLCSDFCYRQNISEILENHRESLLKTFRYLRDNIPRLFINYVPVANLNELFKFNEMPLICRITNRLECPCYFQYRNDNNYENNYKNLMQELNKNEYEIVKRMEFHQKEDFTIVMQPFSTNSIFPTYMNGSIDLRYLTSDCFHFSQLTHARITNSLWNNMFQEDWRKTNTWTMEFQHFECPTERRPFLVTRKNSMK